jgi:hypothetical protein
VLKTAVEISLHLGWTVTADLTLVKAAIASAALQGGRR